MSILSVITSPAFIIFAISILIVISALIFTYLQSDKLIQAWSEVSELETQLELEQEKNEELSARIAAMMAEVERLNKAVEESNKTIAQLSALASEPAAAPLSL